MKTLLTLAIIIASTGLTASGIMFAEKQQPIYIAAILFFIAVILRFGFWLTEEIKSKS